MKNSRLSVWSVLCLLGLLSPLANALADEVSPPANPAPVAAAESGQTAPPAGFAQFAVVVGGTFRSSSFRSFFPELQWAPSWRFSPKWELLLNIGYLYGQRVSGGSFSVIDSKILLAYLLPPDFRVEFGGGAWKSLSSGSVYVQFGGALGLEVSQPIASFVRVTTLLISGDLLFAQNISAILTASARLAF